MKKSRKELLIKIHKCSDVWRKHVEKEFPELFKKDELEVGKWYKTPRCQHLMYLKSISDNGVDGNGYGINVVGAWFDYIEGVNMDDTVIATDKEVETALIKEAKKRGFKEGVKCLSVNSSDIRLCGSNAYYNGQHYNQLLFDMTCCVFENGKWSTVIKTITKEQAEKELGKTIID